VLGGIGELALAEHDASRAEALFRDALTQTGTNSLVGPYSQVAPLLVGLAKAAAMTEAFPRAARLFGAADQELNEHPSGVGALRLLLYNHLYEKLFEEVRSELGDEPFAREFARGSAMSFPAILDYATAKI
jgi:hypothetical protein